MGDPGVRICAHLPIREVRDERWAIGPHTSILECEPMKTIDLFYQGEGVAEIEYLEIEPDTTFADLKARLIDKHGGAADALLFAEDEEDPLDDAQTVKDRAGGRGLKLHLHRCRHIMVAVTYNGETIDRKFAPGATIARVKRWAASALAALVTPVLLDQIGRAHV